MAMISLTGYTYTYICSFKQSNLVIGELYFEKVAITWELGFSAQGMARQG
jgi:hypothetical protein